MSKLLNTKLAPCRSILLFAFLLLAFAAAAYAQSSTATLSGTIQDENGAVIPGAAIAVVNEATSFKRTARTNESGSFTIPLLPPGEYTVLVEREGFTRVQLTNIVLNVGDQKAVQVQLKVGDVASTVEVQADPPLVRTDGGVSTTIDQRFVRSLPLNGRSFSSLVLLTPGVTVAAVGGDRGQFSVNGQRANTNYFSVDGAGANFGFNSGGDSTGISGISGSYPAESAVGGTNGLVSVDALEEFKVQTSSYTADAGRQPGGQIQVVTKSGKNNFSGSIFEYFRNEALDARNYFNKEPAPQTPLRQNFFGGTFGGPVYLPNFGDGGPGLYSGKDRTFFFFSYEGQRLSLPKNLIANVPSLRLRNAAAANVQPILNFFPLPTGPETTTTSVCTQPLPPAPPDPTCAPNGRRYSGFAPYVVSVSDPSELDAVSIRIDHWLNKDHLIFGRFSEAPSSRSVRSLAHNQDANSDTRTLTIGSNFVLGPRISNELRFNYSQNASSRDLTPLAVDGGNPTDLSMITSGYGGNGTLGFTFNGGNSQIQVGDAIDNRQRQINIVDNVSWLVGSHSFKFGFDWRRLSPTFGPQDFQSQAFSTEAQVLSGVLNNLSITTNQPARPKYDNYSLFAQDTWKATRRLTLDLGVRWEVNPPPTEAEGRVPPLVLGDVPADVRNATLAPAGTPFYKTFWTAFAPRVGAAYMLRENPGHETVLRGGVGVYYDLGAGTAGAGWPFTARRTTSLPGCTLTFPITPACAVRPGIVPVTALPTTTTLTAPNEDLKLPYSLHWNLAVQQGFGKDQTLSVSYVASTGRRLLQTQTLNAILRDPATGAPIGRLNPNFGNINYSFNGPTSDYHSMQVQYQTRLIRGLQGLVNYTWSHTIDEVSSDSFSVSLDKGNASFDIRHNLSAALSYDLPGLKSGTFLDWISRGWSISSIVHAQSGRPVDLFAGAVILEDGTSLLARPDYVSGQPLYIDDPNVPGGRRFNPSAFAPPPAFPAPFQNVSKRQGTFGRNVLRELPIYQVDMALGRNFVLREKLRLELKGEVFNVFNHPMFSSYGTFVGSSTFGIPTTTLSNALGVFGLNAIYQLGGPRSIQLSARIAF